MLHDEPPPLLPARMLNEFVYCPRLFYFEWVQGEWSDNADVAEGQLTHRRVDKETGALPDAEAAEEEGRPHAARSVLLSAPVAGLIARLDLVEAEGKRATPVDYKKGAAPDIPEGAWEPDRVQLCAQGIILRENGYECDRGIAYYAKSKKRVEVLFTDELVRRTLAARDAARAASLGPIPPPLVDSPKCPRCSLVSICLPDETNLLTAAEGGEVEEGGEHVRRLFPGRTDAFPVYVKEQGAVVGKSGDVFEVRLAKEVLGKARAIEVSQVNVYGNVQVTAQAVKALCDLGVPILHFSYGGWFYGMTTGLTHKNVELRRLQFSLAGDPLRSLGLAKAFVTGKIRNCRTMLRRNAAGDVSAALDELNRLCEMAEGARDAETLLGIEGSASRVYFLHLNAMLKPGAAAQEAGTFNFETRNRRPPTDPINALLSYLYAVLAKDFAVTVSAVGFDPYMGFYHRPRYGRTSLGLDLMEEFRPLVADSTVLQLVNGGEILPEHFLKRGGAVALTPEGKKKVLGAYERRVDSMVTHPLFGYTISYRRVFEVQARLLARVVEGELKSYEPFCTR
jgi:CRISP-associated protein Cas1